MIRGSYRIGIVGASSVLGKELVDELNESLLAASDFILFDAEEETAGQVTAVGDEPAFIQTIEPDSFERMDFVFFTGTPAETAAHWQAARRAGAGIVDLSYALESESDAMVGAPWITDLDTAGRTSRLDLKTSAIVAAHPVAVMLGLVAARIAARLPIAALAATVLEPASQHGREAMDEMHQQTINLLSFQPLPKDVYDAQVSFNLLPSLGESAKLDLGATERRIQRHYTFLSAGRLPELALQLVQAPVFHGYTASVLLELVDPATTQQVEEALTGDNIDIVTDESDPPSNLSAAGQEDVMVRVRPANAGSAAAARKFWLWLGADNLKFTARNAIACALELRRMRPSGKVQ